MPTFKLDDDERADGIDTITRFIELSHRLRDLEREKKEIRAELDLYQQRIFDRFNDAGISNIKTNLGTIYVHTSVRVNYIDGDKQRALQYMRTNGLGGMISETLDQRQLAAWLKETPEEEWPSDLDTALQVSREYSLRVRLAGKADNDKENED